LNANTGLFKGRATDTSATAFFGSDVDMLGTSTPSLRCAATTAGNGDRVASSANPFTWGSGDILSVSGRYEAA